MEWGLVASSTTATPRLHADGSTSIAPQLKAQCVPILLGSDLFEMSCLRGIFAVFPL